MRKIFVSTLCVLLLAGCGSRARDEKAENTASTTTGESAISETDALDHLSTAMEQLDGSKKYIADGTCYSDGGMAIMYSFESDGSNNYRETIATGDVMMEKNVYINGDDPTTYMRKDDGLFYKKGEIINPFFEVAKTMYDEADSLYITDDNEYYLYQAYIGPEAYEHFNGITRWHKTAIAKQEKIEVDFVVLKQTGRPVSMTSRSKEGGSDVIFSVLFNEFTGDPIELPEGAENAVLLVEETEEAKEPAETSEPLAGGWAAAEDGTITDEIAEMVAKATEGLEATYEPKKLLETQVVAGTNYRILCDKIVEGAEPEEVTLTIYKDLEGNVQILDDPEAVKEQAKVEEAAEAADKPVESAEPTAEAGN